MKVPRLVLLTDRTQLSAARGLVETVRVCAEAGLRQVVVREHDLDQDTRHRLVIDLAAIDGLVVISSRRPEPAAAGIHLAACQAAPDTGWFGRSCHTVEEVHRAAAEGAGYVTLSPFAATRSKPGYGPPVDLDAYADGYGVPVLALGGIGPGDAARALAAGAHGVAVMGAVMRAADPAAVVRGLLAEVGG
ncbi:thiamine phosphate synthase [Nocardioides terrisoli]|uniref:thiamine phosphate synthase n=1 Tax=Nocardioides terrisoli TaxID=3388267 RepID=UPI00287BC5F6|nr:thiamine phosphate synthase [Nocardioides marmorisolisilvae]